MYERLSRHTHLVTPSVVKVRSFYTHAHTLQNPFNLFSINQFHQQWDSSIAQEWERRKGARVILPWIWLYCNGYCISYIQKNDHYFVALFKPAKHFARFCHRTDRNEFFSIGVFFLINLIFCCCWFCCRLRFNQMLQWRCERKKLIEYWKWI